MLYRKGRGNQFGNGSSDLQPCPHRSRGVILMRLGITEIDEESVAQILGDIAVKAFDDGSTSLLVGTYDFAILFRVELFRQSSGIDQITEHHRQLATLARRRDRCSGLWLCVSSLCRRSGTENVRCEGGSTAPTELGGGPYLTAAAGTHVHEFSPTLLTEFHLFRILTPTVCTAHAASLLYCSQPGKEN